MVTPLLVQLPALEHGGLPVKLAEMNALPKLATRIGFPDPLWRYSVRLYEQCIPVTGVALPTVTEEASDRCRATQQGNVLSASSVVTLESVPSRLAVLVTMPSPVTVAVRMNVVESLIAVPAPGSVPVTLPMAADPVVVKVSVMVTVPLQIWSAG